MSGRATHMPWLSKRSDHPPAPDARLQRWSARGLPIAAPLAIAAAALAVGGCGSSAPAARADSAADTRAAPNITAARGHGAPASSDVRRAALTFSSVLANQFPTFHAIGMLRVIRTPAVWMGDAGLPGDSGRVQAAELERRGFVAAARQSLFKDTRGAVALSDIVEEFDTPHGASAELKADQTPGLIPRLVPEETIAPFKVPRIPGATGYEARIPGRVEDTVAFSDGRMYYRIQALAPPSERGTPGRSRLIAAMTALYDRLRSEGS